jgi:hypothetical protein
MGGSMDTAEGLDELSVRARRATIAAWIVIGFTALLLVLEGGEAIGAIELATASDTILFLYLAGGIGYTIAFIASVVLVAMWIHRAHANLHEAGLSVDLDFTPGWAVGWYFIPIANLFKPYQAMRELWNASTTRGESFSASAPAAINAWWATWIIGNIISNISTRMSLSADAEISALSATFGAISSLVIIPCAWLLIGLIRDITAAQRDGLHVAHVFD